MPLAHGNDPKIISKNIKEMIKSGHPREQAIAAALRTAQRTARGVGGHAGGTQNDTGQGAYGLIQSTVPGRTDRHEADLPPGSYVLPADIVAGLGEGNSLSGSAIIDRYMHSMPYGISGPNIFKGNGSIPHAPSGYDTAQGSYAQHHMAENVGQGFAYGGASEVQHRVPTILAGGEFILPPHMIAYHPTLGGGNPNNTDPKHYHEALKHGHKVLDRWVVKEREKQIKTLRKLPGPKK